MKTVIEMAREAGLFEIIGFDKQRLERFAALVREDEREACAKVCEHNKHRQSSHDDEYATGYVDASLDCAAAIRARGE